MADAKNAESRTTEQRDPAARAAYLCKIGEFDPLSLDEAAGIYEELGDADGARKCREQAGALREMLYRDAKREMEEAGGSSAAWMRACLALKSPYLDGYRDTEALRQEAEERFSASHVDEETARLRDNAAKAAARHKRRRAIALAAAALVLAIAAYAALQIGLKPRRAYDAARALEESGKYEEAIAAYTDMYGYRDTKERIAECRLRIRYEEAVELEKKGMDEEAIDAYDALGSYLDCEERSAACRDNVMRDTYAAAAEAYAGGDLQTAYRLYASLGDFGDALSIAGGDEGIAAARSEEFRTVGGHVFMGRWPQTKAGTDETPIEWIVLDVQDGRALLLSLCGIECMPYNDVWTNVTWEDSMMRRWLNGEFLASAFDGAEREAVALTDVKNDRSQGYARSNSDGGPDTQDRVFLLSYAEAWKYMPNAADRRCRITAHAKAQGAEHNRETRCGWWWLRSPGNYRLYQGDVFSSGIQSVSITKSRSDVVRPAMWVELDGFA